MGLIEMRGVSWHLLFKIHPARNFIVVYVLEVLPAVGSSQAELNFICLNVLPLVS